MTLEQIHAEILRIWRSSKDAAEAADRIEDFWKENPELCRIFYNAGYSEEELGL